MNPAGSALFCGRYYESLDGIANRLTINITSAASRLVEILDIMFNPGRNDAERLERNLIILPTERLQEWFSKVDFEYNEVPVNTFLLVLTLRESIKRLNELAEQCDSP